MGRMPSERVQPGIQRFHEFFLQPLETEMMTKIPQHLQNPDRKIRFLNLSKVKPKIMAAKKVPKKVLLTKKSRKPTKNVGDIQDVKLVILIGKLRNPKKEL